MENDILQRLDAHDKKLDEIFVSVEKTRRYVLWYLIVMILSIVVPLAGLAIAVPRLISVYSSIGAL